MGDLPLVSRKTAGPFGNGAHSHRMGIAPGEQAGAGGRAHRRHVEIGISKSPGSQRVDIGCFDLGAVTPQVGKPDNYK